MRMGGDLTVMMLIEVEPTNTARLQAALLQARSMDPQLADFKLFTHVTEPLGSAAAAAAPASSPLAERRRSSRFRMAAVDRPGLLHIVTSASPPRVTLRGCARRARRALPIPLPRRPAGAPRPLHPGRELRTAGHARGGPKARRRAPLCASPQLPELTGARAAGQAANGCS